MQNAFNHTDIIIQDEKLIIRAQVCNYEVKRCPFCGARVSLQRGKAGKLKPFVFLSSDNIEWTLYHRGIKLKGGRYQEIYFFSRSAPEIGTPVPLPFGYDVAENKRTGLPYLRKRKRKTSELFAYNTEEK